MSDALDIIDELEQALIRNDLALAERVSRSMVADVETSPVVAACMQKVLVSVVALRSFEQARALVATEQFAEALKLVRARLKNFQEDNAYDQELPTVRALDALEVLLDEREGMLRLGTVDDTLDVAQHAKVMSELLERASNEVMDSESTKQNLPLVPDLDKDTSRRPTAKRDSGQLRPVTRKQQGPLRSTEEAIRSAVSAIGGSSSASEVGTPMLLASVIKALFRVKPILIGVLVMVGALALGIASRSVTYRTEISLLRSDEVGESLAATRGRMLLRLPKDALRRLPQQPEVLSQLEAKLATSYPSSSFSIGALDKSITSTVDTGEYGATDVVLNLSFSAGSDKIAQEGGDYLMQAVIDRHDYVVTGPLRRTIDSFNDRADKLASELDKILGEIEKINDPAAKSDSIVPMGDYEYRISELREWLAIARKELSQARAFLGGSRDKSAFFQEASSELAETDTVTSESSDDGQQGFIVQQFMRAMVDKQLEISQLESKAEEIGAGSTHPVQDELRQAHEDLKELASQMQRKMLEAGDRKRISETTRSNPTKDEVEVDRLRAEAETVEYSGRVAAAQKEVDDILDELRDLLPRGESIAELRRRYDVVEEVFNSHQRLLLELESFQRAKFSQLQLISQSALPIKEQGSMGAIVLLALTAGLVAAALVSLLDTYEIDVAKESRDILGRGRTVVLEFIKKN